MLAKKLLTFDELKYYLSSEYGITKHFYRYLDENDSIREIKLNTKTNDIPQKLYQDIYKNPGEPCVYDIALGIRRNSYITGYKLISLLGWTDYIPKVIHVNWVRGHVKTEKTKDIDNLTVQKIAFKPKQKSRLKLYFNDYEIIVLSGQLFPRVYNHHFMSTDIIPELPAYTRIFVPERLIIEALINYHYFGGSVTVWRVGIDQIKKLNMKKMKKIFEEMRLIYPYANAIGYWFERAGISKKELNFWRNRVNKKVQFHLFMGDQERRIWNEEWHLYVPRRFAS